MANLTPWRRRGGNITSRGGDEHPLTDLHREMNRLFDSFFGRFDQPFGWLEAPLGLNWPQTDVVDTGKEVKVSVELPGINEKDIEVNVTDGMLTIRGEKKADREESREGYRLSERSFGSFHRAISLPDGTSIDEPKAEFKNGVLTVTLQKTPEAAAKVKRIEVKAT